MTHPVKHAIQKCLQTELGTLTGPEVKPPKPRILIAYSGGLDSSVLLQAITQFRNDFSFDLEAVHVDHQLQNVSGEWSTFCKQQCELYQVPCYIKRVDINTQSGGSIEALARQARYEVFHALMDDNTFLMTAHHADDQFETFLLQLFRGAGPKGLSAMASGRELTTGKHLRPVLDLSREQLENHASEHAIKYIEDPSNQSSRFDRNFLRNQLIPQIKQRYPGVQRSVLRSVRHIASEHQVLDGFLDSMLSEMCNAHVMQLNQWKTLGTELQSLLLRKWISDNNTQLPSTKILEDILTQLQYSHGESKTHVRWSNVELRVYKESAFLLKQVDDKVYRQRSGQLLSSGQIHGLSSDYGEIQFDCDSSSELVLRIEFRQGGERLRLPGHKHHLSIKQLFQKKGVLPWMRSRIPLLFEGELLVAVGDLWLNADWLEQQKNPVFKVQWHNRPQVFS